jgi:site-specific recombinase XerD
MLEINKTERNLRRNLSENEKHRLLFLMELDSVGSRAEYMVTKTGMPTLAGAIVGHVPSGKNLPVDRILFQTRSGRNINRKNFARLLNTLALKAGLSSEIHPHTARVSFIRQKQKENMDIYSIRKKVGHSSVRTTERYLG